MPRREYLLITVRNITFFVVVVVVAESLFQPQHGHGAVLVAGKTIAGPHKYRGYCYVCIMIETISSFKGNKHSSYGCASMTQKQGLVSCE